MADVLYELKNLSETLKNRNTTLPKAHILLTAYKKRIKSFIVSPGSLPFEPNEQKKEYYSKN